MSAKRKKQARSQKKLADGNKSHSGRGRLKSEGKQNKENLSILRVSDEEDGLSIPFSMWCEQAKKVIKGLGGKWCPVFKIWKLERVQMQLAKRELTKVFGQDFQLPPYFVEIASQIPQTITINRIKITTKTYELQTHPLYSKLYAFQRQSLQFCLKHHGRILIGDEMGVGKSIQSLACSLMYTQSFPLLIICPSALKYVWKGQAQKWLSGIIHKQDIQILKKASTRDQAINAKVLILSYEIATKITEELDKFNMVICDQAHYLKNKDTIRCEQLVPYLSQRKRIFLLTGTPALAKPRQLYNLLKILRPDVFKSFESFGQRYCQRKQNPWTFKWEFQGAKNLAQLHYILKKGVMIRRLKQEVLPQLPSKQRQIIFMQTEKAVIGQIKQLLGSSMSIENIRNSEKLMHLFFEASQQRQRDSIMRCYLLSGLAKLQSVKDYISAILQNDVKIIVFAHHQIILDSIEAHLTSQKAQYIRLDGESSPQLRKKQVDAFQNQTQIKVALLSITAMGTGFTLTAASTMLFAQLHWTPAILIQAQDRIHRIGQKSAVNIHYLIGDKTLDPLMLRQLQRKIDTVGRILDGTIDRLNLERVEDGCLGNFEIQENVNGKSKGRKITDYFSPAPIIPLKEQQEKQIDKKMTAILQEKKRILEREMESQQTPTKTIVRKIEQEDSDSLFNEILRRKSMKKI